MSQAPPQPTSPAVPGRLFVFGLGYSARAFAEPLLRQGWRVAATTRDEDKAYRLSVAGYEMHFFDRGRPLPDARAALAGATHILSSVPPDEYGDAVIDHHAEDIAALSGVSWAGYLSTTGVYGDRGGDWVDEETPPRPGSQRSQRRAAAERAWWDLHRVGGLPVQLFRLAGIYGPRRNALLERLSGKARRIVKPGQLFSRIHVDDIAGVLTASLARPRPWRIFNVADDEPAAPADLLAYASRLLGLDPPPEVPFEEARLTMSPMQLSFWAESRRVRNQRIKDELGYRLLYPTYREGLQALLETLRP